VIWHKIFLLEYDVFSDSLKNKLRNPYTVVLLDENDWNTILESL